MMRRLGILLFLFLFLLPSLSLGEGKLVVSGGTENTESLRERPEERGECIESCDIVRHFQTYQEALRVVEKEQMTHLNLGNVPYSVEILGRIKRAMPQGAHLHFSAVWGGHAFTDKDTELDLGYVSQNIRAQEIADLLFLLPDLKNLDLHTHTELANEDIAPLVDAYPETELIWMIHLSRKHLVKSDATAYSTLRTPDEDSPLTAKNLTYLRYAKNLKALDLGHNRIEDISFLKDFPGLRILILADNRFTDIAPLEGLTELEYLELFMNDITTLEPLSGMAKLRDLNISACDGITSLAPLDGIPALERLWCILNRSLPASEIQRFRQKHPSCRLNELGGHATDAGWREHPRFAQYREMFLSGEWTPFE